MAKKAVCDICGKTDNLEEPYGFIPEDWFRLQHRRDSDEQDLCSVECLALAVSQRIDAMQPAQKT